MFLQVICTHIVFKDTHCKTISLIPDLQKNFIVNTSDLDTVVFHPARIADFSLALYALSHHFHGTVLWRFSKA